jgi:hypothetical protein
MTTASRQTVPHRVHRRNRPLRVVRTTIAGDDAQTGHRDGATFGSLGLRCFGVSPFTAAPRVEVGGRGEPSNASGLNRGSP